MFFRTDLPLLAEEESDLAQHRNPIRRLEWMAGRWLLHKLTKAPQRLPLAKDAFAKPFFPENQEIACSLSHSKGNVGALISNAPGSLSDAHRSAFLANHSIGCDIQVLTPKMPVIAPKFLNKAENDFVESRPETEHLDLLHLYWTAKESLYKAYGLKALDFRQNILVSSIRWDGLNGTGTGEVKRGAIQQDYQLIFSKLILPEGNELIWAVCRGWLIGD
ncbi:MAG: 4'-phosphopantetheinyl transferase family protein [Saprospiraceae bacterium]